MTPLSPRRARRNGGPDSSPPYPQWTAQFPALWADALAAAEATGARLVSMENVYLYGRPAGHPLTEDRAHDAHTTKGQLRGRMTRELLAAHHAGRVEVAIGRASDYFGPRGGAQSNLGDRVFPAALAGRTDVIAVIPWRYAWRRYVRTPGDAWR